MSSVGDAMGQSIAVMNTKGGVGKSTIVMALAETLSVFHGKNVLVIDSDSQTSMSTMLMHVSRWETIERQHRTLVDYLVASVIDGEKVDWRNYVATGVSDVDDAQSVYLIPSHMELSLFERQVSADKREDALKTVIAKLLEEAKRVFDVILIDCPPGLSVLTEIWLRTADHFIPPTKPDYLSVRGLSTLNTFRQRYQPETFANLLGVLVNLKDGRIGSEEEWHRRLAADPANRVFKTPIPRRAYIQRAADFEPEKRTYVAKYPGDAGQSIKR
ncbi:MAG: ParA family protein [Hyphomicrobiaceae bacterium]